MWSSQYWTWSLSRSKGGVEMGVLKWRVNVMRVQWNLHSWKRAITISNSWKKRFSPASPSLLSWNCLPTTPSSLKACPTEAVALPVHSNVGNSRIMSSTYLSASGRIHIRYACRDPSSRNSHAWQSDRLHCWITYGLLGLLKQAFVSVRESPFWQQGWWLR